MQASIVNKHKAVGRLVSNSEIVEVCLSDGELLTMSGDRRGTRLESLAGTLWITQSGDPEDHWLPSGQSFVVSHRGKVVITGTPRGMLRVN